MNRAVIVDLEVKTTASPPAGSRGRRRDADQLAVSHCDGKYTSPAGDGQMPPCGGRRGCSVDGTAFAIAIEVQLLLAFVRQCQSGERDEHRERAAHDRG